MHGINFISVRFMGEMIFSVESFLMNLAPMSVIKCKTISFQLSLLQSSVLSFYCYTWMPELSVLGQTTESQGLQASLLAPPGSALLPWSREGGSGRKAPSRGMGDWE